LHIRLSRKGLCSPTAVPVRVLRRRDHALEDEGPPLQWALVRGTPIDGWSQDGHVRIAM
jgi:hypothetical protein